MIPETMTKISVSFTEYQKTGSLTNRLKLARPVKE